MKFKDHVLRLEKMAGGEKQEFLIERWKCQFCPKQKLHRVLPDFLAPNKHYNTDIIADVLDNNLKTDQEDYEDFEDYPCEKTLERWSAWLTLNLAFINTYLRSEDVCLSTIGFILSSSTEDPVPCLRQKEPLLWLRIVLRAIYNTGSSLESYHDHP